jgi:hypothetical protein
LTAKEASRLAIYVGIKFGVGICATPLRDCDVPNGNPNPPGDYALDLHLRGNPEHVYVHEFRRSVVESAIDELWLRIFPDIL